MSESANSKSVFDEKGEPAIAFWPLPPDSLQVCWAVVPLRKFAARQFHLKPFHHVTLASSKAMEGQ